MNDQGNSHLSTLLIEWKSDTAYDMIYIRKPEHNHDTPKRYMYTYMIVLSSFVLNHAESTLFEVILGRCTADDCYPNTLTLEECHYMYCIRIT
jgi:hypothetical protein